MLRTYEQEMRIFSWGANVHGQLGLGYDTQMELLPVVSAVTDTFIELSDIKSICGGDVHTLILTKKGVVYSCGGNHAGQLGQNEDENLVYFKKVRGLEGYIIVQIACGWNFSAAVAITGQLFLWGSNEYFQLGLPIPSPRMPIPTLLEIGNVKQVSCGLRHMAAVLTSGKVIVSGQGIHGQLGLIDEDGNSIIECTITPVPMLNDIISVACGSRHCLGLRADGTVLAWGDNRYGQLGMNPNVCLRQITPVKIDINAAVAEVIAGSNHSAVLNGDGEIFNFGFNNNEQLGDSRNEPWRPQKLHCEKIIKLAIGGDHNLAITSSKKLLSWGWNMYGNCGNGTILNLERPEHILNFYETSGIGIGCRHSFAVATAD